MIKTKKDARYLLKQVSKARRTLTDLCSEFDFDTKENRRSYSVLVGRILVDLWNNVYEPIYDRYPDLCPPELQNIKLGAIMKTHDGDNELVTKIANLIFSLSTKRNQELKPTPKSTKNQNQPPKREGIRVKPENSK